MPISRRRIRLIEMGFTEGEATRFLEWPHDRVLPVVPARVAVFHATRSETVSR